MEQRFGPWIIHNATPDSTCPPDAVGKRGRVQLASETRLEVEKQGTVRLEKLRWHLTSAFHPVVAWQALIEPVRGEVVLGGVMEEDGDWVFCSYETSGVVDITLPTLDGALVCARFAQVDDAGALVKDGAIVSVGAV